MTESYLLEKRLAEKTKLQLFCIKGSCDEVKPRRFTPTVVLGGCALSHEGDFSSRRNNFLSNETAERHLLWTAEKKETPPFLKTTQMWPSWKRYNFSSNEATEKCQCENASVSKKGRKFLLFIFLLLRLSVEVGFIKSAHFHLESLVMLEKHASIGDTQIMFASS